MKILTSEKRFSEGAPRAKVTPLRLTWVASRSGLTWVSRTMSQASSDQYRKHRNLRYNIMALTAEELRIQSSKQQLNKLFCRESAQKEVMLPHCFVVRFSRANLCDRAKAVTLTRNYRKILKLAGTKLSNSKRRLMWYGL